MEGEREKRDSLTRIHAPSHVIKKGFTLTEILVAVTILVIAVAAIYTSFKGGTTSWTKGTARMERYLNARAALDMISREIQCAMLGSNIIFRGKQATWNDNGTDRQDDELYFVAAVNHPAGTGQYDLCEIGYYLNESISPSSSNLMRRLDDIPDSTIEEKTGAATLVSNVISLNFEYGYYNDASGGFIFTNSESLADDRLWDSNTDIHTTYYRPVGGTGDPNPSEDELPHAVKITIQVRDDQAREDPLTLSTTVYMPAAEER
ncbi:type II secretion system protein [bacterium]|nr:type II secretion system protein [bacterium]MCK4437052.1 type II secretion system protein [bacterium]